MQEIHQIAVTSMPAATGWDVWAALVKLSLDVMTALGTLGAVVVALWIALRDGREKAREKRASAQFTGWLLAPELGELKATCVYLRKFITQIRAFAPVGNPIPEPMRNLLLFTASRMDMAASNARLTHLKDLPGEEGLAIAALVGQVPKIQASVRLIAGYDGPTTVDDHAVITKLLEGCDLLESYLAAVDFQVS